MNKQIEIVFDENEIDKAAEHFLGLTEGYIIFAFSGQLGAGKTTFINALCRQLNAEDAATSPTYSIIQEYPTKNGQIIYHMDWYRLRDAEEALNAGVEDCLDSGHICMIEWPEKALELLPEQTIFSTFNLINLHTRKLVVTVPD
ncbi:MAG: tRNA (adenosine(37)-N6)-threonylcarbamoyltransferase complex ATPase subunit type 1 TsaE [Ginsengibacter sp.]|jgi:tRNA threonylcarbamoyladenosine biosynthesis protein TsaE